MGKYKNLVLQWSEIVGRESFVSYYMEACWEPGVARGGKRREQEVVMFGQPGKL